MDAKKIEKLKSVCHITVSAQEIVEVHEKLASGNKTCVTIAEWVIKKAAGAGSCAAGELALSGIFTLAEVVFFPEGEPILVPLEAVMDIGWGGICADIGITALGENAHKYAEHFCSGIK